MRLLVVPHRSQAGRKRQRDIEMVFRDLEIREERRRKELLCLSCGLYGRRIVAREVMCLKLADPISPTCVCQTRVARQALLESALVESGLAKAAKLCCLASKHPDQAELGSDHIGDEAEMRLLCKLERGFSFALDHSKRLAASEKMRDQCAARNAGKAQVTCFLRCPKRGSHQWNSRAHVACPGDDVREPQVDSRLEAEQPTVLNQVDTELAEAESRPIVAEPRSQEHSKPDIGKARGGAVTMFEAQIGHVSNDETM